MPRKHDPGAPRVCTARAVRAAGNPRQRSGCSGAALGGRRVVRRADCAWRRQRQDLPLAGTPSCTGTGRPGRTFAAPGPVVLRRYARLVRPATPQGSAPGTRAARAWFRCAVPAVPLRRGCVRCARLPPAAYGCRSRTPGGSVVTFATRRLLSSPGPGPVYPPAAPTRPTAVAWLSTLRRRATGLLFRRRSGRCRAPRDRKPHSRRRAARPSPSGRGGAQAPQDDGRPARRGSARPSTSRQGHHLAAANRSARSRRAARRADLKRGGTPSDPGLASAPAAPSSPLPPPPQPRPTRRRNFSCPHCGSRHRDLCGRQHRRPRPAADHPRSRTAGITHRRTGAHLPGVHPAR